LNLKLYKLGNIIFENSHRTKTGEAEKEVGSMINVKQRHFQPQRTRNEAYCIKCEAQVHLVAFREAANFCGIGTEEIVQAADRGEIHRLHNSEGRIMICFKSLREAQFYIRKTETLNFDTLKDFHLRKTKSLSFTTKEDIQT
jgi:hypothetical protein